MAQDSLLDLVGQTLEGIYLVEGLVGKGSMGAVYSARSLRTDGMFAIKVLNKEAAADQDLYTRFRNEARVTSVLRHPGIVQVFDFAQLPDGRPYLVMEFLKGEDLHHRLRKEGRLPLAQAVRICRQVGIALHAAHKLEVVHRDLKPGNIFLVPEDQGDEVVEQAKIIDFGLSRIRGVMSRPDQTLDSQILGTPQYMSPEAAQALNSQLDGRSDQFSLAIILYLMLTGVSPFADRDMVETLQRVVYKPHVKVRELRPEIPAYVAYAIDRALSKAKVERFANMIDFVRALEGQAPLPAPEFQGADTIVDLGCRPRPELPRPVGRPDKDERFKQTAQVPPGTLQHRRRMGPYWAGVILLGVILLLLMLGFTDRGARFREKFHLGKAPPRAPPHGAKSLLCALDRTQPEFFPVSPLT